MRHLFIKDLHQLLSSHLRFSIRRGNTSTTSMPRQTVQCVYCSKVMRADNLKRHIKSKHLKNSCAAHLEENKLAGQKRSLVSDDEIKFGSGKFKPVDNQSRNIKIQNEIPSKRRTKADIIGYSDGSETDEDDNTEPKPKVNDEVSSSSSSSSDDKEPADTDNEENEDELKRIINSTVDYVIANDKKELTEILTELKEEATEEEYLDTLFEFEELMTVFFTAEFLDEEKPILPMIDELVKKLKNSLVLKSKSHRLKMLVDDINKNRYRVKSILTTLNNVQEDDIKNALGRLAREELLSEEQYDKLIKLEKMDLPTIARVINETKVGRGLSFLPRKVSDLKNSLYSLLTGLGESGNLMIKKKLAAVLEELRRLKAISDEQYTVIKKDNDIM